MALNRYGDLANMEINRQGALAEALSAVLAAASSLSSGVDALHGPLEQEIVDAADACWTFTAKPVQVGNKFLLQRRTIQLTEAAILEDAEENQLGGALSEWLNAAEGAVASTALELHIAEQCLLHATYKVLHEDQSSAGILALLDALLAAYKPIKAHSTSAATAATLELLQASTLQAGSHYLSQHVGSSESGEEQLALVAVLKRHVAHAPFAAALLQPEPAQLPSLLPAILATSSMPVEADQDQLQDEAAHIKAQTLLLKQVPWERVGSLGLEAVRHSILAPLIAYAEFLSEGQQNAAPERIEAASEQLQVFFSLAKVNGLEEDAFGLLLVFLISVARGCSLQAALKSLGVNGLFSGNPAVLQGAGVVEWAQLVWRCPSSQTSTAAGLAQSLPWHSIKDTLPGSLRIRALMTLIAVAKATSHATVSSAFCIWLWKLLEGPIGSKLTSVETLEQANEAHTMCMTQAPEGRLEIQALWAWLQLQLATNLLQYQNSSNATTATHQTEASTDTAGFKPEQTDSITAAATRQNNEEVLQEQPGVFGHVAGLLEAMQFWSLFELLLQAEQPRVAAKLLVRAYSLLRDTDIIKSQLHCIAHILAAALAVDPTKDEAVIRPIRDLIAFAVEAGLAAHADSPDCEAQGNLSPHKQYHAPAKRGSTAYPGLEAVQMANHWASILAIASSTRLHLPKVAAALLSNLAQLLFYHPHPPPTAGNADSAAEPQASASETCARLIVGAVGCRSAPRLASFLMDIQKTYPKDLQWLPVLACWLSNAAGPSPSSSPRKGGGKFSGSAPSHPGGALDTAHLVGSQTLERERSGPLALGANGRSSLNRKAEEALQIQDAAMALGYSGAALPLWEEFLQRYFTFQTQLQALVPVAEISQHLAELGQLYEAQSPLLGEIYTLIAPLSPETLPGGTARFLSDNWSAIRALMQLHPMHLTAAPRQAAPAYPETSNPQSTNVDSQLLQKGGNGTLTSLKLPAVDPSTFAHLENQQRKLIQDLAGAEQAIQSWVETFHLSGSQTAAGSPGGRRVGEIPLPEVLSNGLNAIWVAQSKWREEIEMLQAGVRELVQRRYQNVDLKTIEAGELGDVEEVSCKEEPTYEVSFKANRERAVAAVVSYCTGGDLIDAAVLLFQLEMTLLEGQASSGKSIAGRANVTLWIMDALADTVLDCDHPVMPAPYLTALFQRAVGQLLGSLDTRQDTQVRLVARIVEALAAGGSSGFQRHTEAAVLLGSVLNAPDPLAACDCSTVGRCLLAVLAAINQEPSLNPTAVAELLACFDCGKFASVLLAGPAKDSGLEKEAFDGHTEAGGRGNADCSPPRHLVELLGLAAGLFALAGGQAAGAAVVSAVLGTGHETKKVEEPSGSSSTTWTRSAVFAASLSICLTAWGSGAGGIALQPMLLEGFADLPLSVALDSIMQVTQHIQETASAANAIPHPLLAKLVRCPAIVASLRALISGSSNPGASPPTEPCWTASVGIGVTVQPDTAVPALESPSKPGSTVQHAIASTGQSYALPRVLLIPITASGSTGEVLEALLGACLQAILEKHGSGLEGVALNEEFNKLLAVIMEPAAENAWMVDWLWDLYKSHLRPFLSLANDASGGAAVTSFRHFWACLPWRAATFHTLSPDAVADLGGHILNSDRAVLELLHALDWAPVLQQLGNMGSADRLVAREACRWATQLVCLAIRAFILLRPEELPEWLQRMLAVETLMPSAQQPTEELLVPTLQEVIRALDAQGTMQLRGVLCSRVGGVPFLLQPLVVSPTLVQGNPDQRLLHVSRMLRAAAAGHSSPQLVALAAAAIRTILFASVARMQSEEGSAVVTYEQPAASPETTECWHLPESMHIEIASGCLLQLAKQHAGVHLAKTARGERHGGLSLLSDANPTSSFGASKWRPPELSQLAGRVGKASQLADPDGVQQQHWGDAPRQSPTRSKETADSADAALPIAAFLDLLSDSAPDVLHTPDPLPFANAAAPMRVSEAKSGEDLVETSTPDLESLDLAGGAASSFLQTSMSRFKQKLEGSSPKAPKDAKQEAPSARLLQIRLAELLRDGCKDDLALALCTLRLLLTSPNLRKGVVPSALQEALFLDLAVAASQRAQNPVQPERLSRQGGQPLSAREQSVQGGSSPYTQAYAIFEGLSEGEIMGICHDASVGRAPLTQAAASHALREGKAVRELEKTAWRLLALEVVKMASEAEARRDAPAHIVALWLVILAWVGDVRWRSSQSSGSEILEGFLDSMQRHTDLLRQAGQPDSPEPPDGKANLVASAAERLRELRASLQARLAKQDASYPPDVAPDPAIPESEFSPQAQAALGLPSGSKAETSTSSTAEKAGKRLAGLGKGIKQMVAKARRPKEEQLAMEDLQPELKPQPRSRFFRGRSNPGTLSTVYSDSEAEAAETLSPEAKHLQGFSPFGNTRGSDGSIPSRNAIMVPERSSASGSGSSPKAGSFFGRAKERLKRGLVRDKDKAEAEEAEQEQMRELAALEETVALGLATFAVQAYLKSVLCPSLSDYTPRATGPQSRGAGLSSRQSSLGGGLDSLRGSLGGLSSSIGMHRANASVGSTLSSGAVLDEAAMRELDQLMEARTELDALEEILNSPLIVANMPAWTPFFAATPQLLSSSTTVEDFQRELVALLFPGSAFLNLAAGLLPREPNRTPA